MMEAKVVKRGFDFEGSRVPFPLQSPPPPNQLTPPATKSSSQASHGLIPSRSSDPNDPPHPFLTNVGKLNGMTIVRGGFRVKKEEVEYTAVGMRCFPPPPNAAYGLLSQAYDPDESADMDSKAYTPRSRTESNGESTVDGKHVTIASRSKKPVVNTAEKSCQIHLDGSTTDDTAEILAREMGDNDPRRQQLAASIGHGKKALDWEDALLFKGIHQGKTKGEILADTIDFKRPSWVMTTPGVSGYLYPAEDQREDYIRFINADKPALEYCKKCETKHIPPGPPITLEDRDTCGAYLPEWFPAEDYEKPWKYFKRMIDDVAYLTELTQGYNHKPNPDAPAWDLQFHDYSKRWRAIGRRGGWWKCRDGEGATEVERNCDLCHDSKVEDKKKTADAANTRSKVQERLDSIQAFVDFHMKRVCEKDKEIVLARARTEGIPPLQGPWAMEEERFGNGGWNPYVPLPTSQRSYSMYTDHSSMAYGSPLEDRTPAQGHPPVEDHGCARGRSPPRGRSLIRIGRE